MKDMDFPRFEDVNIAEAFEKMKDSIFEKYRGTLIMKKINPATNKESYYWNNLWFDDLSLAKLAVDNSIQSRGDVVKISMTIVKKDGSEVEVGEEHTGQIFCGGSPFESFKKSK